MNSENDLDKARVMRWYQEIEESETGLPSQGRVRELIAAWKEQDPAMHNRLRKQGLLRQWATICLASADEESDLLIKSGWSPADAMAEASREHLMLEEPEDETEDRDVEMGPEALGQRIREAQSLI